MAIDPMTLMSLLGKGGGSGKGGVASITGGIAKAGQLGLGIYQMYKGNKLAKEAAAMQQDYKTPQVIEDSLTNAQIRALEGMPAEMKAEYIQNLQNSTQSGINALSDRKAGISGVEGLLRNEQGSYMNLASQDASMKLGAEANLQGVQQNVAGYRDKEYDINVLQPYMAKLGAAEAMKGAGLQNTYSLLSSTAKQAEDRKLYNDILGQNNQQPTQQNQTAAYNGPNLLAGTNTYATGSPYNAYNGPNFYQGTGGFGDPQGVYSSYTNSGNPNILATTSGLFQ